MAAQRLPARRVSTSGPVGRGRPERRVSQPIGAPIAGTSAALAGGGPGTAEGRPTGRGGRPRLAEDARVGAPTRKPRAPRGFWGTGAEAKNVFKTSESYRRLFCRCLRPAPLLLSPFPAACGRASPTPAAFGLWCLHLQWGAAGAPRRVTSRGELLKRGFSPPQPQIILTQKSPPPYRLRAPAASAAPSPVRLWCRPRRPWCQPGDRGKGVPHGPSSGLGATNPVPQRSPVETTVRIAQASLHRSSSWRPVAS